MIFKHNRMKYLYMSAGSNNLHIFADKTIYPIFFMRITPEEETNFIFGNPISRNLLRGYSKISSKCFTYYKNMSIELCVN